jgi:hypothetical protein
LTDAEVEEARILAAEHNPNAVEISPPTAEYNCHGFTCADSHGWFNHPQKFFVDDFDQLPLESAQRDDIVVYMSGNTLMHTAKITRVVSGQIDELESKWGSLALLSHSLTGVPAVYGDPAHILRRK